MSAKKNPRSEDWGLIHYPREGRFDADGSEPPESAGHICIIHDIPKRNNPCSFQSSTPCGLWLMLKKQDRSSDYGCPMARRQNRGMSTGRAHSRSSGPLQSYALTTSRSPQQYHNSPVDHGALWRGGSKVKKTRN